jgi:hypothetical protein
MSMIGFPLLLIPLAVVNIAVFLMGLELDGLQKPIGLAVPLLANNSWAITYSDALLSFSLFMLFFEVVKSARPGAKYFTDHLLSLLVFAGAAAEFLLLPKPCSTRKAGRRSPAFTPSGTRTVPDSVRPADGIVTDSSRMTFAPALLRPHPEEAAKRPSRRMGGLHGSRRSP